MEDPKWCRNQTWASSMQAPAQLILLSGPCFCFFRCTGFSLPHLLPVPWENRSHWSPPSLFPTHLGCAPTPVSSCYTEAGNRGTSSIAPPAHPLSRPHWQAFFLFFFFCKQVLSSPSSQGCSLPPILSLYLSLALRGFVPRLRGGFPTGWHSMGLL